jgi:ubiquinone/menaquinone biosynthesis C-methylase UbiE
MHLDQHKNKFGNQAENYSKYRRPYVAEVHDLLFSLLPEKSGKILDIACGTGKSTEPLVRDGFEVFGVDHDPLMIEEANKQAQDKNLKIQYSVAQAESLPFSDNYFDAITIGTAFHWFVNEAVLSEIKRVLKSGGLLFIFWTLTTKEVPEEDAISREIFQHFKWEKVPQQLRDLDYISSFLKDNNFNNISTARIPFTHEDTVEDQVGLMKTASNYELLSEDEKKLFIEKITADLTQKIGDRKYFIYEEEIQVCYGTK